MTIKRKLDVLWILAWTGGLLSVACTIALDEHESLGYQHEPIWLIALWVASLIWFISCGMGFSFLQTVQEYEEASKTTETPDNWNRIG